MAAEACRQASRSCPETVVFTWAATLVFLLVLLMVVVAFWLWWRQPNKEHDEMTREEDELSREDYIDSRERLDLLRAARRWGDVSTTDVAYLRRRR